MQGWNWNSVFKRKGPEKSADEPLPPFASDTRSQGAAAGSTRPSITKQPLVIADTQQKQPAEHTEVPSGSPQPLGGDLQPWQHMQVQHQMGPPAAHTRTADQHMVESLPAQQQHVDEELQPLRQRLQQRDLELQASKWQQQSQRATPSKARKLLSTPSPARQQRQSPQQSAGGRSIADLQRFAFDASKQQRTPAGAASLVLLQV